MDLAPITNQDPGRILINRHHFIRAVVAVDDPAYQRLRPGLPRHHLRLYRRETLANDQKRVPADSRTGLVASRRDVVRIEAPLPSSLQVWSTDNQRMQPGNSPKPSVKHGEPHNDESWNIAQRGKRLPIKEGLAACNQNDTLNRNDEENQGVKLDIADHHQKPTRAPASRRNTLACSIVQGCDGRKRYFRAFSSGQSPHSPLAVALAAKATTFFRSSVRDGVA